MRQAVFEKTEHIEQSRLPRTVCTDKNTQTGNILQSDITERLEVLYRHRFQFHYVPPLNHTCVDLPVGPGEEILSNSHQNLNPG